MEIFRGDKKIWQHVCGGCGLGCHCILVFSLPGSTLLHIRANALLLDSTSRPEPGTFGSSKRQICQMGKPLQTRTLSSDSNCWEIYQTSSSFIYHNDMEMLEGDAKNKALLFCFVRGYLVVLGATSNSVHRAIPCSPSD